MHSQLANKASCMFAMWVPCIPQSTPLHDNAQACFDTWCTWIRAHAKNLNDASLAAGTLFASQLWEGSRLVTKSHEPNCLADALVSSGGKWDLAVHTAAYQPHTVLGMLCIYQMEPHQVVLKMGVNKSLTLGSWWASWTQWPVFEAACQPWAKSSHLHRCCYGGDTLTGGLSSVIEQEGGRLGLSLKGARV